MGAQRAFLRFPVALSCKAKRATATERTAFQVQFEVPIETSSWISMPKKRAAELQVHIFWMSKGVEVSKAEPLGSREKDSLTYTDISDIPR